MARITGISATGRTTTVFQVPGQSAQYVAQIFGTWGTPIDAQTQADYDNSPTSEGVFVGGTGHAAADVITMSDGSLITADNETAGVVDQFTVDSSASTGADAGDVLTQVSSTGSGVAFTLTPDTDNILLASGKLQFRSGSTFDAALPWHDIPGTGGPYTADAEETVLPLAHSQVALNLTIAGGSGTSLSIELTGGQHERISIVDPA